MSYVLLAGEIRKLCTTGASGTLYATTEDNHSARIVVDGGGIVSLVVGRLRGAAGIDRLKTAGVSRYRFQHDQLVRGSATDAVPLSALLEEGETSALDVIEESGVGEDVLEIVRREALECMGPMAHMICTDHLRGVASADAMAAALTAIGNEMGDSELGRDFVTRVQSRLRRPAGA